MNGQYLIMSIGHDNTLCLGEILADTNCISIEGFDKKQLKWIGFENGDWKHWPGNIYFLHSIQFFSASNNILTKIYHKQLHMSQLVKLVRIFILLGCFQIPLMAVSNF